MCGIVGVALSSQSVSPAAVVVESTADAAAQNGAAAAASSSAQPANVAPAPSPLAAPILLESLTTLQHRGQDAAGIATTKNGVTNVRKSNGLVEEVFKDPKSYQHLVGPYGIGHVRYPTAGSSHADEAQPFYTNSPFGISLSHNGNLTNVSELRKYCKRVARRQINTGSDSELLLAVFSAELERLEKVRIENGADEESEGLDVPSDDSVFQAVTRVMELCRGAYAVSIMISGFGILGFRDPCGIRPLCFGSRTSPVNAASKDYMLASESVPLEISGFTLTRDVAPGEAILVDMRNLSNPVLLTRQCVPETDTTLAPCMFEFVYFARQDSVIDGASVYEARANMGDRLGKRIKALHPDCEIDVVVPVPSTSRISAQQCANVLGVPYMEALVRNRYSHRTFIMPGQTERKKSIRLKLNPISHMIRDKSVLIVDDSVVRGTTSKHIVEVVRASGAKHVYFASAAPAIRHPNVYGIDMPTREELIAFQRTEEEIASCISAEWIVYQTIADLKGAVRDANPKLKFFDMSCFDGIYVAGQLNDEYFADLSQTRNSTAKVIMEERASSQNVPDRSTSMSPNFKLPNGNKPAETTPSVEKEEQMRKRKERLEKRMIRTTPSEASIPMSDTSDTD